MKQKNMFCVSALKIRYFGYNCFEILLPDGKTLVIDPCLEKNGEFAGPWDERILEGCDYVYVNHTHTDHVASLGKVYDRFQPTVFAHERVAFELARFYDIPYWDVYPYATGQFYDMGDFSIRTVPGRHNDAGKVRPSGKTENPESFYASLLERLQFSSSLERELFDMGAIYNHNFLLTLPNNLRVGFIAGKPGLRLEEETIWKELHPDIVIAQRASINDKDFAKKMAYVLKITGARVLLPTHIEDAYTGKYNPDDYVAAVNRECQEQGIYGRMIFLQRAKWYEIMTGVSLVQ